MAQRQYERIDMQGVIPDLTGSEIPLDSFSEAVNFVVRENKAQRAGGYEQIFGTPGHAPKFLLPNISSGQSYWLYVGDSAIRVTDGTSHFNITPASAPSNVDDWTGTNINNFAVLNNSTDDPVFWDGQTGNVMTTLTGWPPTTNAKAGVIRAFKNYLFALNITDTNGTRTEEVRWSDSAPPGSIPTTWAPATTNDAGSVELADTPGVVIDAARLRDSLYIYKDFSTYAAEFIGDVSNDIFSFRLVFPTSGILSANCVASFRNRHYVMTKEDIVEHDGVNIRSIADKAVRNFYVNNLNYNKSNYAYAVSNGPDNEIWFCIPVGDDQEPTIAMVYNIIEQKWGFRSLDSIPHIELGIVAPPVVAFTWSTVLGTWADITQIWNTSTVESGELNLLMAGENDTKLFAVDLSDTADGSNVEASIERHCIIIESTDFNKLVTEIRPRIKGRDGDVINIRVGGQEDINDPINWTTQMPYTIGTSKKVDLFKTGRYISVAFSSTTASVWSIESFDIAYQIRGAH